MKKSKIVLVSGHFNILHPGHLRLFRFAKDVGDNLVVAVESDRVAGKAVFIPEHLRLEGVQANSWVDKAFIFDSSIEDLILKIKPDVVVKGKEHESKPNPEHEVLASYGASLVFSSGESLFASYDLLKREFGETDLHSISLPNEFMGRHNILQAHLSDVLTRFSDLSVCVIGDLIVDEYITCQTLGMSQEDPTIVVTPIDTSKFIGGAGIVAAHASSLGAKVSFLSIAGDDESRDFALERLSEAGVKSTLMLDSSRPTTLKQRFRSKGKSLLRVSHLHQEPISMILQNKIIEKLKDEIQKIDLIVFSDFNYGCLPQGLVDKIILMAKLAGKKIAADSQSSSQIGNIARFRDMDLITPTEHEARISVRNHDDGLVVLAEKLRQESGAKNIILKLGEEGLLTHSYDDDQQNWLTEKIGALNTSPKDVSGAGDSLLIVSAMALASGSDIFKAACLGSLAAAIQVGREGNIPITINEIMQIFAQ